MRRQPAADHAVLSDCRTAALVGPGGAIDWWPGPRFDGPSVFTRVLGPDAGHFSIAPAAGTLTRRAYRPGTFVLESEWSVGAGRLLAWDCLALEAGARGHEIGRGAGGALVRVVAAVGADVAIDVAYVPRLEYGLAVPQLSREGETVVSFGGPERLVLRDGGALTVDEARATGRLVVPAGERRGFVLHRSPGLWATEPAPLDAEEALAATTASWESWSAAHDEYDGPYRDEVLMASRTVQAMTHQRTGAIVAAATASLPEHPGGDANWDYRFGWLRDASMTARALLAATCADEAKAFFAWMTRAAITCSEADHVQIVFGVEGERELDERQLPHLSGVDGSVPVRIGNAAWRQVQLDAPGEILDVACSLAGQLDFAEHTVAFLRRLVDLALDHCDGTDAGIWERREGDREHTFSRVMCWVALDRAVRLRRQLGAQDDEVARWAHARRHVHAEVLDRGWNEERQALVGVLDGDGLDAALLLLPAVDFLPGDDPRMRATVRAIERDLGCGGGLIRRLEELPDEGAFLPACFWLAMAQAQGGDAPAARATFERAAACANDVGLLAELADPQTRDGIGNLPQVISHVALIAAAQAIGEAES